MKKNLISKSFIIFSVIFGINSIIFAQNYFPFPDSNAKWHVLFEKQEGPSCFTLSSSSGTYFLNGDSIIGEYSYHKIFSTNDTVRYFNCSYLIEPETTIYVGGIREDSLKRIFFIDSNSDGSDSTELLLYQFGLNVGDTVVLGNNIKPILKIISSIDSVLINGRQRTRYRTQCPTLFGPEYWIEGIGSTQGLFETLVCGFLEAGTLLTCFEENNFLIYQSSSDCAITVGGTENIDYDHNIKLFSNPIEDILQIQYYGKQSDQIYVTISNLLGEQIISGIYQVEQNRENIFSLNISILHDGIYFFSIHSKNSYITKKIIKL